MKNIPVEKFGKDHWSLLVYIETRVVDHNKAKNIGDIDKDHLRCNENVRPTMLGLRQAAAIKNGTLSWSSKDGTILKSENGEQQQLKDHDDWDCLEDLEKTGFIEIISLANCFIEITEKGLETAAAIRKHKAAGGNFASFEYKEEQK